MARPEVPDDSERQQKDGRRERSQHNQRYVNDPVDFLAAAAVFAAREVIFVVLAHLGRQAGDVIAPAGQNLAYEGVDTLAHTKWLQPDGLQWFELRSQHHAVVEQRLTGPQGLVRRSPGNLGMIVVLGEVRQNYVCRFSIIVAAEEFREGVIG